MRRRVIQRLQGEEGIAMVLVVFAVALLATLSVVLVNTVTDESGRSAKAVVRQSAFEAAESGLDDYIAKLADDRQYYLHWVHPAESTRQDDGTGGTSAYVSPSGSSPAPSDWCRDPKTKPAPVVWSYGPTWLRNSKGKDHWCSLGNGYEYDLQITPPTAAQTGVTIVSTGRSIANPTNTRVIEAVVKQSSITDFQEIADDDIGWASGATAYGLIYSNHNISWSGGTAYGSNFAVGSVTGSVSWQGGATGFDGSSATAYTNLFQPPSPLTQAIDFNTFLASFSDISSAAKDATGGGIYLDSSYGSWRLTFNAAGTVKVEGCSSSNPQTSSTSPSCTTVSASRPVPTNGAIYSDVSVIVQGTVRGRVTVATPGRIIIGGNLLYASDAGNILTDPPRGAGRPRPRGDRRGHHPVLDHRQHRLARRPPLPDRNMGRVGQHRLGVELERLLYLRRIGEQNEAPRLVHSPTRRLVLRLVRQPRLLLRLHAPVSRAALVPHARSGLQDRVVPRAAGQLIRSLSAAIAAPRVRTRRSSIGSSPRTSRQCALLASAGRAAPLRSRCPATSSPLAYDPAPALNPGNLRGRKNSRHVGRDASRYRQRHRARQG